MKKVSFILAAFAFAGLVACGPSASEQAEKAKADSTAMADSMAKAAMIEQASSAATPAADTTKVDSSATK